MEQASSAFSTGVPALDAISQLAGNSRQGFGPVASTMHWASGWVISSTALGIKGSLYDGDAGSRSPGKELDSESQLAYFEARYFSSNLGRFLSPDWSAKEEPIPYAKMDDPQSLNLYNYVGNNPVTRVDADGHVAGVDDAVVGAAVGITILAVASEAYFSQPEHTRDASAALSAATGR